MVLREWFLALRAREWKYVRTQYERAFMRSRNIGEVSPAACFGFSYYDPHTRSEVWHLMPLNWFVQLGRAIQWQWWRLQSAQLPDRDWYSVPAIRGIVKVECEKAHCAGYSDGVYRKQKEMLRDYADGYQAGLHEGYRKGLESAVEQQKRMCRPTYIVGVDTAFSPEKSYSKRIVFEDPIDYKAVVDAARESAGVDFSGVSITKPSPGECPQVGDHPEGAGEGNSPTAM